ncbi:hypothetical protein RIF29_10753 [Crotalaria pallida]|uniref:Uncharacterized protein n=1 Tax=Crotalaria pallida TaxID=3830 RepID=A0AAN9FVJ0_CROPI
MKKMYRSRRITMLIMYVVAAPISVVPNTKVGHVIPVMNIGEAVGENNIDVRTTINSHEGGPWQPPNAMVGCGTPLENREGSSVSVSKLSWWSIYYLRLEEGSGSNNTTFPEYTSTSPIDAKLEEEFDEAESFKEYPYF